MQIGRQTRLLSLLAVTLVVTGLLGPAGVAASGDDGGAEIFERFKALEGQWQATSTAGWSEVSSFEVIARGSVVMGTTTFRDAPDRKMVTMFYLDGEQLVAVHYCEARNQPTLRATQIDAERGEVLFTFAGGGNLPTRDRGHMDKAIYRFLDGDRFTSKWTWFQDGAEDWFEDIVYERVQ